MTDVYRLIQKAKRRKYHNKRCEASRGWHTDTLGHPVVDMCAIQMTKYYPELGLFGMYLCDEHFELFVQKLDEIE